MRDNPILKKKKLITAPFSFKNKDNLVHWDLIIIICLITNSLVIGMNDIRIRGVPTFTFFMELERNYQREGGKIFCSSTST